MPRKFIKTGMPMAIPPRGMFTDRRTMVRVVDTNLTGAELDRLIAAEPRPHGNGYGLQRSGGSVYIFATDPRTVLQSAAKKAGMEVRVTAATIGHATYV